jgi:hypothetical protein
LVTTTSTPRASSRARSAKQRGWKVQPRCPGQSSPLVETRSQTSSRTQVGASSRLPVGEETAQATSSRAASSVAVAASRVAATSASMRARHA